MIASSDGRIGWAMLKCAEVWSRRAEASYYPHVRNTKHGGFEEDGRGESFVLKINA